MSKDDLSMVLTQLRPGEGYRVARLALQSTFRDASEAEVTMFANEHACDFHLNDDYGLFTRRPLPLRGGQ